MTCESSLSSKTTVLPVLDDGHAVVALLRQFPDERTVLIRDVDDFETGSGKFQDAALDNAIRAPRKLNQLNHVKITAALPAL